MTHDDNTDLAALREEVRELREEQRADAQFMRQALQAIATWMGGVKLPED